MSRTDAPSSTRRRDAGVTLVEMLVVVALIGTVAGAVGLGLGSVGREVDARREAELLAARMRRASEEALLTGQAVAILWTDRDYRFVALVEGDWAPHPVALLAGTKALGGGVRFEGEAPGGGFAVTAAALPAGAAPLVLRLGSTGGDQTGDVEVTWDGATATLAGPDA